MNIKLYVFPLLFFTTFHLGSSAQIAYSVAKDDNNSDIDYKVEWGYEYAYQAGNAARIYLENKGYKKVYVHSGEGSSKIIEGYYVLLKSTYSDYKKNQRISMGMGVSPESYEEAEKRAVVNIKAYDWSWERSMGYNVIEKGQFRNSGGLQCVYLIDKVKNGACINYATEYTCIVGSMDNKVYNKLKEGKQGNCTKNNLPPAEIGRFRITKRYIAVLTCLQVCATDNIAYPQHKIVEMNSPDELKTVAPMIRGQVFKGSGFGYFVDEVRDLQGKNSSSGVKEEYLSYVRSLTKNTSDLMSTEKSANEIRYYFKGKSDSWGVRQ